MALSSICPQRALRLLIHITISAENKEKEYEVGEKELEEEEEEERKRKGRGCGQKNKKTLSSSAFVWPLEISSIVSVFVRYTKHSASPKIWNLSAWLLPYKENGWTIALGFVGFFFGVYLFIFYFILFCFYCCLFIVFLAFIFVCLFVHVVVGLIFFTAISSVHVTNDRNLHPSNFLRESEMVSFL